jgi:hypothetical protein
MRPAPVLALAFSLGLTAAAADAQTHAPAAVSASSPAPRYLPGFTHPELTACQTIGPARRECAVPANVGGGYLIEAVGLGVSTGPDATLAMNILVGNQVCIMETGGKFTGNGYLHEVCETTLATDAPIKISVNLAARNATLDAGGPKVVIRPVPWDGVVSVRGSDAGALPATPAAAGAKPPPKSGH